jgi:hypothetical protein
LTFSGPGPVAFGAVTLNGQDQTATASFTASVSDMSGSGGGWRIAGTSTAFQNQAGRVLPATSTTVTAASVAAGTGNCSVPSNQATYPVTLPAGSTPPPAATLYSSAPGTGAGPADLTFTVVLTVPASAYSGDYTATWTLTASSGP